MLKCATFLKGSAGFQGMGVFSARRRNRAIANQPTVIETFSAKMKLEDYPC